MSNWTESPATSQEDPFAKPPRAAGTGLEAGWLVASEVHETPDNDGKSSPRQAPPQRRRLGVALGSSPKRSSSRFWRPPHPLEGTPLLQGVSQSDRKLLRRLFQSHVAPRQWSSASQARHGVEEAEDYLRKQVLGNDARLASIAAGALRRSSGDLIAELAEVVLDDQSVDEIAAGRVIEALGWARYTDAAGILGRGVEPGRDEHIRLQSLWAVGWRGREEERGLAEAAMDDTSLAVRVMAAWAVIYNQDGGYEEGTGKFAPKQASL